MIQRIILVFVMLAIGAVPAFAQQPLTPAQQNMNRQHELTLSDLMLQELRGRCGNIARQAMDLEDQLKILRDEHAKQTEELTKLKALHPDIPVSKD